MQDQGKRLLIFALISMALMFAWQTFFPPPKPEAAKTAETPVLAAVSNEAASADAMPHDTGPSPADIQLAFTNVRVRFSGKGGVVADWQLTDPKYARDATRGNLAFGPELAINFAQGTTPESFAIPRDAAWQGEQLAPTDVRYTWQNSEWKVTKTFRVMPEKYLVSLVVEAQRLGPPTAAALVVSTFAREPAHHFLLDAKPGDKGRTDATSDFQALCLGGEEPVRHSWNSLVTQTRNVGNVKSGGVGSSYLVAVVAPKRMATESVTCQSSLRPLTSELQNDLLFPAQLLATDAVLRREVVAFIGPKHYHLIRHMDVEAGYTTGLDSLVDFGWFGFIGRPLLSVLQFFHTHTGSWGLAIILLTVLVKLVTLPWTTKSMRSMKEMAKLAPKMKEVQDKYPDNREKQQLEMAAMYKEHNISPVAGCLPMFLQMPVWLALYQMLSSAGEMYLEKFAWINDLTIADPKYILPALLLVTMIIQTRLQPQTQVGLQQKIIMWGLPIGFGIAAFVFPAGLSLYMLTNTVLSALHSLYMNRFDTATPAGAATATIVSTPPAVTQIMSTTSPASPTNGARKKAKKKGSR